MSRSASSSKKAIHSLCLLLILSMCLACGKLPDYVVNEAAFGFSVTGEINPRIDILFVVDNSGSMSGNQTILSDSMQDFMNTFASKSLEFHIGVISTDQYCNSEVHSPVPNASTCNSYWSTGGYGSFYNDKFSSLLSQYSGERFLTWLSPSYITKFENNVLLGVNGNGSEMPILSATKALSDPRLTGWNLGFVRDDSYLAVIMVSDEDETTVVGSQTKIYNASNLTPINNRVDAFVDAAKALKGNTLPLFSVDVIARPTTAATCTGSAEIAYGLNHMVNRIKAQYPPLDGEQEKARFSSICSNFAQDLATIGETIVLSNARINLVQSPADTNEVYVTNNGITVPRDTVNGWQYYSSGNYIQFYGTEIPNVGDQIMVAYTPSNPL